MATSERGHDGMTSPIRDQSAIVGVGHSPCRKDLGSSPLAFTIKTCLEAIEDAGLQPDDIDGLCAMGDAKGRRPCR